MIIVTIILAVAFLILSLAWSPSCDPRAGEGARHRQPGLPSVRRPARAIERNDISAMLDAWKVAP